MKKLISRLIIILTVSALVLTGCTGTPAVPAETTGEPPLQTKPAETTSAAQPEETTAPETTESAASASLNALRQAMVGTSQLFAVAYFGYHDTIDSDLPVDPFETMRAEAYWLCQDLPFLLEIPEDRIIGENGDLFCIVPLDPDASIDISKAVWNEETEEYIYEDSLYYSETGEPILLFCNDEMEPDSQLYISGPSGDACWYPMKDANLCADPLRNENWETMFLDFSPYREMRMADYRQMKDSEWVMPTAQMLQGTTWVWNFDHSYQVTFHADTLSVRWNDGIDEMDHEYPDAAWELTYDEGFAILSIDFREFAGILRYNLLYHEVYESLYVGMDVVQEEMPIGWEPLYRFLSPKAVPIPSEMIGEWELAWTEVEGDRVEVAPGTEHASIFLNDSNVMRISVVDNEFPKNSFRNKELAVYTGEVYPGCGNNQWMAYIGYMGPRDIIYSVTLTDSDTLLMQLYWEVDGAPMVATKWYRRTFEN